MAGKAGSDLSPELHEEVLSVSTAEVIQAISPLSELRFFYLAGGTALALHLGHRKSDDLGLFTERVWAPAVVVPALSSLGTLTIDMRESGILVGKLRGVRVSLFHYPYVLLDEVIATPWGIPLAGLLDIACMKLVALSQRGSRKDFIDIFFLAHAGISPLEALRALRRKAPGVEYNPVHIARSLAYFDDAEDDIEPVMLAPLDWGAVKDYCVKQARALLVAHGVEGITT